MRLEQARQRMRITIIKINMKQSSIPNDTLLPAEPGPEQDKLTTMNYHYEIPPSD